MILSYYSVTEGENSTDSRAFKDNLKNVDYEGYMGYVNHIHSHSGGLACRTQ